jgi:hypothetical protein
MNKIGMSTARVGCQWGILFLVPFWDLGRNLAACIYRMKEFASGIADCEKSANQSFVYRSTSKRFL